MTRAEPLATLLDEVRACARCDGLPLGPRPLLQAGAGARALIVGQAPGRRTHLAGAPWRDDSGDRLRGWLGVDEATFYDPERFAILPLGLCYPGAAPSGGDAPPRPECAPLWHDRLRAALPGIRLVLLVGTFAQARYLGRGAMTPRVRAWAGRPEGAEAPRAPIPLPHPSWRVRGWMRRNPWFEREALPALRLKVAAALAAD